MYRFFVEPSQITDKEIRIVGKDVNHIKNVLRMKIGEEIAVSDGESAREYRCGIKELTEDEILCELRFIKEDGIELPSKIYLFQGLPKGDKMELIIQKAVELGVYEIIPVSMKRSIVKLDEKKAIQRVNRWQAIAEAAAKQSKRAIIPQIHSIISFQEALKYSKEIRHKILPYELAEGMEKTREVISSLKPGEDIAVFIGPEGGFDEAEVEAALAQRAEAVTLGKRILRTETAGLTMLSILMYELEQD